MALVTIWYAFVLTVLFVTGEGFVMKGVVTTSIYTCSTRDPWIIKKTMYGKYAHIESLHEAIDRCSA